MKGINASPKENSCSAEQGSSNTAPERSANMKRLLLLLSMATLLLVAMSGPTNSRWRAPLQPPGTKAILTLIPSTAMAIRRLKMLSAGIASMDISSSF